MGRADVADRGLGAGGGREGGRIDGVRAEAERLASVAWRAGRLTGSLALESLTAA